MFNIRIADTVVEIDNRFACVENACRAYLTEENPSFRVRVTEEEIRTTRQTVRFLSSDAQAESYLLGRRVSAMMPAHGAFLLHSSVVECHGMVCAFCAPCGVGKSTHTALWRACYGNDVAVLNGDKPLLRPNGDRVFAYGTPWGGKEGEQCNRRATLTAICFLEQAPENEVLPVSRPEEVDKIIRATIAPATPEATDALADLIAATVRAVPVFRLRCNMNPEAARTAYRYLFSLKS